MFDFNTHEQQTLCRRKGVATVELALTVPILLILLLGAIDTGQYANVYQTVSNASREGARVAARGGTFNVSAVEASVVNIPVRRISQCLGCDPRRRNHSTSD